MKNKYLIKLSLIFSLLFLLLLTSLFSFLYVISLKPVKINLLDYFDRKSEIYKKYDIREVGSVYVSFNRISKNFEILAEDIIIGNNHLDNILIGIDITLSENLFDTTLKIFDGRFDLPVSEKVFLDLNNEEKIGFDKYVNFLNFFKNIEIINSSIELKLKKGEKSKYIFDLLLKGKDDLRILISKKNEELDNFLLVEKENDENLYKLKLKNFSFEFLNSFSKYKDINFEKLVISGKSSFYTNRDTFFQSLEDLNFKINSEITFETNKGVQRIFFKDSDLIGMKTNDSFDIKFEFSDRGIYSMFEAKINLTKQKPSSLKVISDKVNTFQLLELWPKNFQMSVYEWMLSNSSGNINNFILNMEFSIFDEFKLKSLKGNFEFSDIEIRYMENMPVVKNLYGKAEFFSSNIIFNISSGDSENLDLIKGTVDLFDLDTDLEKANISLKIKGKNSEVIDYLDKSIIDKNTYSELRDVSGNNIVNLDLSFPLLVNLKTEQIIYESDINIDQAVYNDFFSDADIKDFNLDILVNNSKTEFKGGGKLLGSNFTFNGNQINKNNNLVNSISGNYIIRAESLPKSLFNIEVEDAGLIPINFKIELMTNNIFKFEGIGNLDKYGISSKFLGENIITKGGRVRFIISPYGDLNSIFFDLDTENLKVEINANFDEDTLLNAEVTKLISPNQDFKLKYNKKENLLKVYGKKLNLINKELPKNKTNEVKKLFFESDLSQLKINQLSFTNPKFNFSLNNGIFDALEINLVSNEVHHKVFIGDYESEKKFVLESNYLPDLINIFGKNLGVTRGSLKIEGYKNNLSNNFEGMIAGKDIVFSDAPFFADFFSLFSLQGLAQKIKDGGIIFDKLNAKYEFGDEKLRIIDSLLKGSELGIQFDSVIGLDSDYFLTNGSIIPAYTLNTLITKFPIVGDIITAGSPEDGLIGANFKIENNNSGELEVSYNPISVFVPNIIKNFLTD
ncbi:MAG: DUF3971 domain-containing protein [Alphaproteobacteria bacterium]|tara:strand:- start:1343 stop:4228 length:2886 start_codon:yes stop_codon:yes gene_type:complete